MSLGFDSDLRIKLKKKEDLKKDEKIIGIKIGAEIKKNKLSPHGKAVSLEIIFPYGIQKSRELVDLAVEKDIIQKSGNWYSYQGQKLGNGREAVIDYLIKKPSVYSEIEQIAFQNATPFPEDD